MNKLDTKTLKQLSAIGSDASTLIEEINAAVEEAKGKVDDLMGKLNEKRQEAADLMEEKASDAESYFDEKSEKWQEGDNGQVYSEWKDRLRQIADDLGTEMDDLEWPEVDEPDWLAELHSSDDYAAPGS
jgi:glutaredoxin 2